MPAWLQVLGRFHLLLLHLPIGLIAALAALEAATLFKRPLGPAALLMSVLAAGAAVFTATTGFVLSYEGGFDAGTLWYHQWLGIGVAAAAVITCGLYIANLAAWRRAALAVTLGLLVPAGHLGGTLTHGDNFLFAPLSDHAPPRTLAPSEPTEADHSIYAANIAPILSQYCLTCHGPAKHKGGLMLNSPDAILKGSDSGSVIDPGHPEMSELVKRLRLPIDDEDHMPPSSKAQPTQAQIKAIEDWIAAGAGFTGDGNAPAPPSAAPGATPTPERTAAPLGPDPVALAALRDRLVHAEPVAQGSDQLVVSFAAIATSSSDALVAELLTPLADHIADLSLSRAPVTDQTLELAAKMKHLKRLDLRGTKVTAAGLDALLEHPALEELNLVQTAVGDDAVDRVLAIPHLKQVFLWHAGLTADAIAKLRAKPELSVDAGDKPETAVAQTEPEIKLTSDAPPPGGGPAAGSLTPVNTTCPVTGEPVNPKYAIVFEGKVIGFCCPNCPKEFWKEPEKYVGKLK